MSPTETEQEDGVLSDGFGAASQEEEASPRGVEDVEDDNRCVMVCAPDARRQI